MLCVRRIYVWTKHVYVYTHTHVCLDPVFSSYRMLWRFCDAGYGIIESTKGDIRRMKHTPQPWMMPERIPISPAGTGKRLDWMQLKTIRLYRAITSGCGRFWSTVLQIFHKKERLCHAADVLFYVYVYTHTHNENKGNTGIILCDTSVTHGMIY